ncbi:MAG: DUF5667 domain-containing protein [Candidatus Paceibacterota bacterium]|jgi:hypothetical protein
MSKKIFLIVFCFLPVISVSMPANAQIVTSTATTTATSTIATSTATTTVTSTEEIQLEDLSIEEPGILPGNPFYFFKEWRRGFQSLFTKNPAKKIELTIEVLNNKAAEIKKLEEIAPQNVEALKKAILSYQETLNQLKDQLKSSGSVNLNTQMDRLLKYQRFFEDLKLKVGQGYDSVIDSVQEEINEIIAGIK